MPGFIDTHVHSPQLDVIASYGTELLDWLEHLHLPGRARAADPAVAAAGAALFLDALLAHGTTAAVVFPTVHKVSVEALFSAASQRGMRLVAGKVLMDRHAPDGLRDDVAGAERDCIDLIQRWHGQGRCSYAVTVRFAAHQHARTAGHGRPLCRADPGAVHADPCGREPRRGALGGRAVPRGPQLPRRVRRHGLLHPRACWRTASGWTPPTARCCATAAPRSPSAPVVQPVPGQRPVRLAAAARAGVAVSVASDVGGGTSLSMLRTLADGYKVQALAGNRLTPGRCCTPPPAARRRRWAWATRSARWTPGHGRPGAVGLGRRPGGRAPRRAGPRPA
jgi:guanine deaminase